MSDISKLSTDDMRALRLCGRLRVGDHCFEVRLKPESEHPGSAADRDVALRYAVTASSSRADDKAGALATAVARCLHARHAELHRTQSPTSHCISIEKAAADAVEQQNKPWWRLGLALRLQGPLASLLSKLRRAGRRLAGIRLPPPANGQKLELSRVALPGIDLSGSTMTDMQVSEVDMTRAILMNARLDRLVADELCIDLANLRGAGIRSGRFSASCSFEGAEFSEAYLQDASFDGCNGRRAFFESAVLMRARFLRCRLEGASFARAWVPAARFRRCLLGGADFRNSALTKARFVACNLSGVRSFSQARAGKTVFKGCTIANTVFHEAFMEGARFENCTLKNTHFGMARLRGSTFRRCTFRNVSFLQTDLQGVSFVDCRLEGTDFSGAKWSQGRLERTRMTKVCLDGATMDDFDVGNGLWMFEAPLHAVRSFSIEPFSHLSRTPRVAWANRRPLVDPLLPRCINGMPRGALDEQQYADLRIRLMERLALAIEPAPPEPHDGRDTGEPPDADRALLWRSCLLDTVMEDPMYTEGSAVLAGLADAYASQLLSAGNTMLIDWPDTPATMMHCISYAIDQLIQNADRGFAQSNSMALMQLVLRVRLRRDSALDMAVEALEATYLSQLPDHVGQQRGDLAPDAFPLWDGVTALLIQPEYYENRLLRRPPPRGRAPYGWAEYIPLRPSGQPMDDAVAHTTPFAAVPVVDFAPYRLLRTAHFAAIGSGGQLRARYLRTLELGADEAVLAAAFAGDRKPPGTLRNPECLLAYIEGADKLQRMQMPDGDITEAHFTTLKALGDGFLDPKPLATVLFCFAAQFTRLASSQGFGTEDASPTALRWYASALVRRACRLDPQLASAAHNRQWTYRLCGIYPKTPLKDVIYTCAAQIYADMDAHLLRLRRTDHDASLLYDAIWPDSWR